MQSSSIQSVNICENIKIFESDVQVWSLDTIMNIVFHIGHNLISHQLRRGFIFVFVKCQIILRLLRDLVKYLYFHILTYDIIILY